MRYSLATLALAAFAAADKAPGATDLKPSEPAPPGCQATYNGEFLFTTVNVTKSTPSRKRDLLPRQGGGFTIKDGVFRDSKNRVGDIVANGQFQFDPDNGQAGAIYNAGWSVCPNGTIAIGNHVIFRNCLSGDFYNIYLDNSAPQCHDVYIVIASAGPPTSGMGGTDQKGDGQETSGPGSKQIPDGQVQAPVHQMPDGQLQAPMDHASQISDGQVQAPTNTASQIGDGQVQAPTNTASQISDGQVQAPTNTASQISDGQVQAPTAMASQIADGQVQAPRPAPAAGNGTSPSVPTPYNGAVSAVRGDLLALVGAGVMAVLLL